MKIIIDTNVILSAVYKPDSLPHRAMLYTCENHELILCDHIISECYSVIKRRFPQHISMLDELLAKLPYELIATPRSAGAGLISDPKDQPILNAAILHQVDIIISGDKHFLALDLKRPQTMSPAQFMMLVMDCQI